jgi:hypothetical protein
MTALVDSVAVRSGKVPWVALAGGVVVGLVVAAMVIPNCLGSRSAADSPAVAPQRLQAAESAAHVAYAPLSQAKPAALTLTGVADKSAMQSVRAGADADAGRKMVRSSSMEMVVQHPAEVADKITALAERLGGYLVTADGGGENASAGMLTVRVPAAQFEAARAEIRKLGLRVESEKVDEQDVTRQYVDMDANLRNLHAEEAQYLMILKQANTVKDLLAVSEKLGEVRGQIEQQQAEFNALSRQTETVAIAISLRTEAEAQVFGLNWRPGYQVKLALRDGLESLATYATAMTSILFYLPAVLLWVGTILLGMLIGWHVLRWIGRRWFGWARAEVLQG